MLCNKEHTDLDPVTGVNFPENTCRRGMKLAIVSAIFGAISQVLIQDSPVIILYATALDSSRFVSIFTTSVQYLAIALFYIPLAHIMRSRSKSLITCCTCMVAGFAMLLLASAAWFGSYAKIVMFISLVVFSLMMSVYISGWFPLIRGIVPPKERGRFFGKLRVSWQLSCVAFLLLSSFIVSINNSLQTLQVIIFISALMVFVRAFYLWKIPEVKPHPLNESFKESIYATINNRSLIGFGLYLFWLYLLANGTLPVTVVMAKLHLKLENDFIIMLSSIFMLGSISGFYLGGKFVDKKGTKKVFLIAHFGFSILNFMLLAANENSLSTKVILLLVLVLYGFFLAAASIAVSSEAFALAAENRVEMSFAVCMGLYFLGSGLSRFLSGWALDSGILAEKWQFFGIQMTQYHSLFLLFGSGVLTISLLLVLVPSIMAKRQSAPM